MPKTKCNLQIAKLYKLFVLHPDSPIYIGSTCNTSLQSRKAQHIRSYRYWLNNDKPRNRYCTSFRLFEKYGPENVRICLESTPIVESLEELHAREYQLMSRYSNEGMELVNYRLTGPQPTNY